MTLQAIIKDTLERWYEGNITADEAMHLIHQAVINHEGKS